MRSCGGGAPRLSKSVSRCGRNGMTCPTMSCQPSQLTASSLHEQAAVGRPDLSPTRFNIVQDWFEELERLVPN